MSTSNRSAVLLTVRKTTKAKDGSDTILCVSPANALVFINNVSTEQAELAKRDHTLPVICDGITDPVEYSYVDGKELKSGSKSRLIGELELCLADQKPPTPPKSAPAGTYKW